MEGLRHTIGTYEILSPQTTRDVGGKLNSINQPFDFLTRSIHMVWWLRVPTKIRRYNKKGRLMDVAGR